MTGVFAGADGYYAVFGTDSKNFRLLSATGMNLLPDGLLSDNAEGRMKRYCSILIIGFITLAAIVSMQPVTLGAQEENMKALAEGNTRFALELYGKLRTADDNLFLSPYSISSALAMAYAGARGETASAMPNR